MDLGKRSAIVAAASIVAILIAAIRPVPAAALEQAKAASERASAYIQEVGEEKVFFDFTRPDGGFHAGELYVFCYDSMGRSMAHGGSPAFVERNLLHIKDPDSVEPNALIVGKGFDEGRGWVDFKWPNPVTKRIRNKSAYVIRTNDVVCGVGYYKKWSRMSRHGCFA